MQNSINHELLFSSSNHYNGVDNTGFENAEIDYTYNSDAAVKTELKNSSNSSNHKRGRGNTGPYRAPLKYQGPPAVEWHLVWNNYPENFETEIVPKFQEICKKYILAKEIAKTGTPHIQGTIILKEKQRGTALTKLFGEGVHFEKIQKSLKGSIVYCTKDNNYLAWGLKPHELKKRTEYTGQDLPSLNELYPWQREILDITSTIADKRTIHWYWEPDGNAGKSIFTKYMAYWHDALFVTKGKYENVINTIFNRDNTDIIIFDLSRNMRNRVSYDAIEHAKNGLIYNEKYETGNKLRLAPHIFVFANYPPNIDRLSGDRWKVRRINNITREAEPYSAETENPIDYLET